MPVQRASSDDIAVINSRRPAPSRTGTDREFVRNRLWDILKDDSIGDSDEDWCVIFEFNTAQGHKRSAKKGSNPFSSLATSINAANYTNDRDKVLAQAARERFQTFPAGLTAKAARKTFNNQTLYGLFAKKLADGESAPYNYKGPRKKKSE